MENKKILILSYWDSQNNYGQILQGVALQYVLRNMGFAPQTLRYNVDYLSEENRKKINSKYYRLYKLFTDEVSVFAHLKRYFGKKEIKNSAIAPQVDRHFDDFKKRNLNLSYEEFNEYDDFSKISEGAYAVIVGSDQVWNYVSIGDRRKIFLLDFVQSPCKKLSYAASFGRSKFANREEKKEYAKLFQSFDAISVREASGVDMCSSAFRTDAVLLPDPTFLLDKQQWLSLCRHSDVVKKGKLVFVYTLVANDERIHQYVNYYKSIGCKIIYVSSSSLKDTYENTYTSIDDWLYYISIADVVVTNSFHGLAFSLNFNTNPICLSRGDDLQNGMNSRIYSILSKLDMLHLFKSSFDRQYADEILKSEINWASVNEKFDKMKSEGMNFLRTNL